MINPDTIVVDVEEQREWLLAHKASRGMSWSQLAAVTGIKSGTLSPFSLNRYFGNNAKVAQEIFKYRQTLETQAVREVGLVKGPGYFDTPTSMRLRGLLTVAHMGRITLAATSPGTGKTVTVREYAASASNVWLITMRKSTKTVNALTSLVLRAMGVPVKGGWNSQLADTVMDGMRRRNGLLIVDEANHLSLDQFEEIRGWHDETQCGVAFLGNEELMVRIKSGPRSDQFARLHSRIAMSHVQTMPEAEDVDCFCDAWAVNDGAMRDLLKRVALTPASGGLREIAQIVEGASMIAADEDRPLSFADLREAMATRATRNIH
ncbi:AAA family ATPase [uncultured Sphingomonas sp.]|uniref:AAA family ATPase n=1 Tax=uncultured Sphingomonas sp. TaxID=158754 RepID=UPI0025876AF5|nr:AAA family ATPase [uncultured Sphingomonas sp.]